MATVYATLTGTSTQLTVGLSGATAYRWEASADVIFSSTTIVDTDATFDYSSYTDYTAKPYIRPVVTYNGTNAYSDIAVIKVYKNISGATRIDITFGSDIESIGDYAFTNCTSLANIDFGSVTTIGREAFYTCSSLAILTIGDSVTSIGQYAFSYCTSLATITVSLGNTTFFTDSRGILYQITDATNQKVTAVLCPPAKTTNTDITIDTVLKNETTTPTYTVTSIGQYAFFGCTSLATIDFGSVTSIGQSAFASCTSLATIDFGSVTSIGSSAFKNCESLATLTIGDSVTSIGDSAFTYCTSLATLVIGDSVTSIGQDAFSDCTSLVSVVIGDSVTSIGDYAFYDCRSLATLTIGDSVTTIGDYAFFNCESLANVYFLGAKPSFIGTNNFLSKSGDTAYYRAGQTGWDSNTTINNISTVIPIPTITSITTSKITASVAQVGFSLVFYISSDDGLTWTHYTSQSTTSNADESYNYNFETGKTYKVSTIANYYNATPDYSMYCKTLDLQSPTLQITSDKSLIKSEETATLTFTFSETVTGFDSSDVTTSNGTLGTLSGSGTTYTATFTPTANVEGTATISIAAGKFSDAAGNQNTAPSNTISIPVDTLAPNTPSVTGTASNTISGTAEANSTLVATNTNNVAESVSVDNTGKWRLKVASIDSYVFRARDTAGNVSNPTTFSSNSFSFRYSGSSTPFRFPVGAPIKSIGMSSAGRISGDTSTSFKIKPALPPGLSFSRRTGKITGTPLETSPATKYTITSVSTVYASRSAKITIEVL